MTVCKNINTLQKDSFEIASDGTVSRRVTSINNLVKSEFDAIDASYPNALTEVYDYYTGGLSGTLVATVTVIYNDTDKNEVDSVELT